LLQGRVEIPLGLSSNHIDELAVLTMDYLTDAEPNEKTNILVNVTCDSKLTPVCSNTMGWTEIISSTVHIKALIDLGYSFDRNVCSLSLNILPLHLTMITLGNFLLP